jgi:acyl carrier protein
MTTAALRSWLHDYIADYLSQPVDRIDFSAGFNALGLDSADAVIAGGFLEEAFDVEIDATLFLRNPDVESLIADLTAIGLVDDGA